MDEKCYTLKIETFNQANPEVILHNVIEFVSAKKYFYYTANSSTSPEEGQQKIEVNGIPRDSIKSAYRLISGSTLWVEIKMKKFN